MRLLLVRYQLERGGWCHDRSTIQADREARMLGHGCGVQDISGVPGALSLAQQIWAGVGAGGQGDREACGRAWSWRRVYGVNWGGQTAARCSTERLLT